MLHIVFDNTDLYYRYGMQLFLEEIFYKDELHYSTLSVQTAREANIIIKKFAPGESAFCHPVLRVRPTGCLLIGLYEGDLEPVVMSKHMCMANVVFINKRASLDSIRQSLRNFCLNNNADAWRPAFNCLKCNHVILTKRQKEVLDRLYQGQSLRSISERLDVDIKTVSVHKRTVMKLLNINSDCLLMALMKELRNPTPPGQIPVKNDG